MKENKEEAGYPRMVVLNYATFNLAMPEQEIRLLKIFFTRILTRAKLKLFYQKDFNSKLHPRGV